LDLILSFPKSIYLKILTRLGSSYISTKVQFFPVTKFFGTTGLVRHESTDPRKQALFESLTFIGRRSFSCIITEPFRDCLGIGMSKRQWYIHMFWIVVAKVWKVRQTVY